MIFKQDRFGGIVPALKVDSTDINEENAVDSENVMISKIGEISNNELGFEKQHTATLGGDVMTVHELERNIFAVANGEILLL